ncbi:unnamed protein product [Rotaria magnacalcarata]|uniref:Uncharacterized protein n=1 Tax=Rotaria magnacalcarata TaxID=392030 RepID=A0A819SC65_9BILA|nr:unnamed protein product [Rotaria magnacalcarata]CAF2249666.1 unnamed protein product [Rotaria magnacalcarata]CAF4060589.1 unnamed protein product [Rotaria magnacalcarata]CAF4304177.1 unnamed protein product [Rotaria magnacalcarata]
MTLETIPNGALIFYGPFNVCSTATLKLSNTDNYLLTYKILTTEPKRYCVKPNAGLLEAHATVNILVSFRPTQDDQPDDRTQHKFRIQWITAPSISTGNLDTFWSQASKNYAIKKLTLRTVFVDEEIATVVPENSNGHHEIDANMTTNEVMVSVIHQKLALIIGNQSYKTKPLRCALKDAEDLADVLRKIGFTIVLGTDCTHEKMIDLIGKFSRRIKDQDLVLFYYAGHGFQYREQNYLLPVDMCEQIDEDLSIKAYAINAQDALNSLKSRTFYVTLFILDCCREYLFDDRDRFRNLGDNNKGLVKMIAPGGSLIQFACAPGTLASDGVDNDKNGLFTKHLLKHIGTPNIDIEVMFRKVALGVYEESKGRQIPYRDSCLMVGDHIHLFTE